MISKIACHFGLHSQLIKTTEELQELCVAINKYMHLTTDDTLKNVIEEMADVELMLEQLKVLLETHDEVAKVKDEKIKRTIARYKI